MAPAFGPLGALGAGPAREPAERSAGHVHFLDWSFHQGLFVIHYIPAAIYAKSQVLANKNKTESFQGFIDNYSMEFNGDL